jgi:anti-sigma regulatory factor (Ser/Thr protein kinase)
MAEEGDTCRISIRDEGQGFCCDKIAVPDCRHKGGRGLCLIKHFMDHVEFDPARRSFEMAFRRKTLSKGG